MFHTPPVIRRPLPLNACLSDYVEVRRVKLWLLHA